MISRSLSLTLAASLAGCLWLSACRQPVQVPSAEAESPATHAHAETEHADSTTLSDAAARAGGVEVAVAGAGTVDETIDIAGRVEIAPEGRGEVRAWYPGRIMSLNAQLGQTVRKGQVLARVESSESLQTYAIAAGVSGVIIEKNANVGDMAYERPIYVIADPDRLQAAFFLFPRDAENVRVGQTVSITTLAGQTLTAKVSALLPSVDPRTQTLSAIVSLSGHAAGALRAGMAIEGQFVTAQTAAPVVVPAEALQTFEDRQVVFVKAGTTYTARPVQTGRQSARSVEISGGLEAGETYVVKGAFLIRADIAKAGAEHEH